MCLYLCLHINPLGRLNNEEQNRSSTGLCQHWTIVCVWVLLCVHRQNGSIFDKLMYCLSVCVCVCVRVAVIHWPDSSSWGSAHIPVITAVPTADWLLSALLRRCLSVRQSHCWFQTKVNTLERRWQNRLVIDEFQSTFDKQLYFSKLVSKCTDLADEEEQHCYLGIGIFLCFCRKKPYNSYLETVWLVVL